MPITNRPPLVRTEDAVHDLGLAHVPEACLTWLATQPDWPTAWARCRRADWMLRVLGQTILGENPPSWDPTRLATFVVAFAWDHLDPNGRRMLLAIANRALKKPDPAGDDPYDLTDETFLGVTTSLGQIMRVRMFFAHYALGDAFEEFFGCIDSWHQLRPGEMLAKVAMYVAVATDPLLPDGEDEIEGNDIQATLEHREKMSNESGDLLPDLADAIRGWFPVAPVLPTDRWEGKLLGLWEHEASDGHTDTYVATSATEAQRMAEAYAEDDDLDPPASAWKRLPDAQEYQYGEGMDDDDILEHAFFFAITRDTGFFASTRYV